MKTNAHAKVNIFLKIIGTRDNYHLLSSRFVKVNNLYDTLSFAKKEEHEKGFILKGAFGCTTEQNSIYKAYKLLYEATNSSKLRDFFQTHEVRVEKRIPEFAGLGGGSSDAAAFLRLANEVCDLKLCTETLAKIGEKIGADVPFFVYDYTSANVEGIGEVVVPFEEELLAIQTFTPPIECDTPKVYGQFRKKYIDNLDENKKLATILAKEKSDTILRTYTPQALNDLYPPALDLYPQLQDFAKEGWFFSGSGSTYFKNGEE